jgi:hypothetical protein
MWYFSVAVVCTYYGYAIIGMEALGGMLNDPHENFNGTLLSSVICPTVSLSCHITKLAAWSAC